jgi:GTP-binding protein EngB required for normal cell division
MTQAILPHTRESDNDSRESLRSETAGHLLSILAAVESISTREGTKQLVGRLRDLHERIAQDQFRVAVVGQFKRGKTSVLNALLGETDLLPVGALPFTSVLTIVRYGSHKGAEVVLQSGSRLSISLAELKDYVTEAGNPNNCKMVEQVEVFYPGEILRGGITLVNSPGFGSISDQNTQTAYDYLPRIDAAVFVTSPDPPLTAAEMEFLKKLALSTSRVFVVMNKIDLVDHVSLSAVVDFTREAITRIAGRPSPVMYTVSALRAAAAGQECSGSDLAGVQLLESDIRKYLGTARDATFMASVRRCLLSSIAELRVELESHIASTATTLLESERKRTRFRDELRGVHEHYAQNQRALVESVSRLADLAENETIRFAESKRFTFDSLLHAFVRDSQQMPKDRLVGALDNFVACQIENLLNCWLHDLEISLAGTLSDAMTRFLKSTNDIVARLHERALEQFGVQSANTIVDGLVTTAARREHKLGAAPLQPRALLLMPRSLLWRWLVRRARERFRRELQRAGQSIARDLNARMKMEIRTFADNVRNRLQESIERIRAAVSASQDQNQHSEVFNSQRIARLSADIRRLDQLVEALNAPSEVQYSLEA